MVVEQLGTRREHWIAAEGNDDVTCPRDLTSHGNLRIRRGDATLTIEYRLLDEGGKYVSKKEQRRGLVGDLGWTGGSRRVLNGGYS